MHDSPGRRPALACLWLARAIPYPPTAGDRIYSLRLAASLAAAGVDVVFAGLSADVPPDPLPGIEWHIVPGGQRGRVRALSSPLPLVAARHATAAYRREATRLVRSRRWDAIVIDHYGAGGLQHIASSASDDPVRVFIAHNHEASVTRSQYRNATKSLLQKAYLWQNWLKTCRVERNIARQSDLITAITRADAQQFARETPGVQTIELTPGYDGFRLQNRAISAETPRSIVLFGSYLWSAKRTNLMLFLEQVAPVLAQADIAINVVGDMDPNLRRSLSAQYRTVTFHGFVEDATPYLSQARMAVLAEPVGGGFKLKLLEYIFHRVPVATLSVSAEGLPSEVRQHMMLANDIPSLANAVVTEIDNLDRLNNSHEGAYNAAGLLFGWKDRGVALLSSIQRLQSTHHGQMAVAHNAETGLSHISAAREYG